MTVWPGPKFGARLPPLSRLRLRILDDLARQLRFAPREVLLRDAARAEQLAAEIDPRATYPAEWLRFRITGYRSDTTGGGAGAGASGSEADELLSGDAILADLSALVERLSDTAGMTQDQADSMEEAPAFTVKSLCARWRVSTKTLERYRRQGLIGRRVVGRNGSADGPGRQHIVFLPGAVERFETRQRPRLERAGKFSRIDRTTERRMLRRAEVYARKFECSLNQAAERLADRYERSPESVRQLLLRSQAGEWFSYRAPPSDRECEFAWRAWRRGLDVGAIGARLARGRAAVWRAIHLRRAARLRTLLPQLPVAPATTDLPARLDDDPALRTPGVAFGFTEPGAGELHELVEAARVRLPMSPVRERELAGAYRLLITRAAGWIAGLDVQHPQAMALDAAETALRWAALLKVELVRPLWPLLVESVETGLPVPIESLRPRMAWAALDAALAGACAAIDGYSPPEGAGVRLGHRLAGAAGLASAKAVAAWVRVTDLPTGGRVAARVLTTAAVPDWTQRVAPWQSWLNYPKAWLGVLDLVDGRDRDLLGWRLGVGARRPHTLREVADILVLNYPRAVAAEQRAWARVRGLVRVG